MKNSKLKTVVLIIIVATIIGVLLNIKQKQAIGAVLPIAGQTYALAGSGVSSSATSLTLQSLTITQTSQKLTDSDFSTTFFVTIEPGNRTKQELVSCTTVTQNAGGTATLSGCLRGLSPISPYSASTTLQFVHAGGSQVIFSDPPQLFNQYAAKSNTELISGLWTASSTSPWRYDNDVRIASTSNIFVHANEVYKNYVNTSETQTVNGAKTFTSNTLISGTLGVTGTTTLTSGALVSTAYRCTGASDNNQLCEKAYIDGVGSAGASDANLTTKGLVEEATLAEVNSSSATGGTGAKLFMTPSTFALSNFASTSPVVVATTSEQILATTTITFSSLSNNYLELVFQTSTSSGNAADGTGKLILQFNGDAAVNYSHSNAEDGGAVSGPGATSEIALFAQALGGGPVTSFITIFNNSGDIKTGYARTLKYATSTGAMSTVTETYFTYKGSGAITSASFSMRATGGGKIATSTYIRATGY